MRLIDFNNTYFFKGQKWRYADKIILCMGVDFEKNKIAYKVKGFLVWISYKEIEIVK